MASELLGNTRVFTNLHHFHRWEGAKKQNIVTLSEVETSQLMQITGFDSAHPDDVSSSDM